eukprot:1679015-Rhodomonas_salina.1
MSGCLVCLSVCLCLSVSVCVCLCPSVAVCLCCDAARGAEQRRAKGIVGDDALQVFMDAKYADGCALSLSLSPALPLSLSLCRSRPPPLSRSLARSLFLARTRMQ